MIRSLANRIFQPTQADRRGARAGDQDHQGPDGRGPRGGRRGRRLALHPALRPRREYLGAARELPCRDGEAAGRDLGRGPAAAFPAAAPPRHLAGESNC